MLASKKSWIMDNLSIGPEVRELEQKLAEYTGSKHCVTVSSGTDSLLIALMALGVGAGDEVITVPYTYLYRGGHCLTRSQACICGYSF